MKEDISMTVTKRRALWKARIADQAVSGQTITQWCDAHEVNRRQFHYWRKHLQQTAVPAPAAPWVRVELTEQVHENSNRLVVRVGAAAIEVQSGFSPTLLADLVRTLASLC
jgi:transposase-like protein